MINKSTPVLQTRSVYALVIPKFPEKVDEMHLLIEMLASLNVRNANRTA